VIGTVNRNGQFRAPVEGFGRVPFALVERHQFRLVAFHDGNGIEQQQRWNASLSSASVSYDAKSVYFSAAYENPQERLHGLGFGRFREQGDKVRRRSYLRNTKISAVYEMIKDEKPNSDKTRNAWYIAASQTFGKETIKIAYANASDGDNPATNTGARGWR